MKTTQQHLTDQFYNLIVADLKNDEELKETAEINIAYLKIQLIREARDEPDKEIKKVIKQSILKCRQDAWQQLIDKVKYETHQEL